MKKYIVIIIIVIIIVGVWVWTRPAKAPDQADIENKPINTESTSTEPLSFEDKVAANSYDPANYSTDMKALITKLINDLQTLGAITSDNQAEALSLVRTAEQEMLGYKLDEEYKDFHLQVTLKLRELEAVLKNKQSVDVYLNELEEVIRNL